MKKILTICLCIISIWPLKSQELIEIESGIKISNSISSVAAAGTIRWSGSDFQGYDGSQWKSLTSTNSSIISYFITLPNGVQTLLNAGETIINILAAGAEPEEFLGLKYHGGYIFKLQADGTGMMTTSNNLNLDRQWGCQGIDIIGADGSAIGTGAQNTIDIINGCPPPIISAAYNTSVHEEHGFDDWFLPSEDEFRLLWTNLDGDSNLNTYGIGGDIYWTSTEVSANEALIFWADDGSVLARPKSELRKIRPIRSF